MGEYLTLFTQAKTYIYGGRTDAARDVLKKLLNSLNFDLQAAKTAAEREKIKKAIIRLLPALDELKQGRASDACVYAFSLDRSRMPAYGTGGAPYIPPKPANPAPYTPSAPTEPAPAAPAQKPPAAAKGRTGRTVNVMCPLTLDDYIGQEKAKKSLRISIGASKKTGRALAHLLICSPYGLGKTTLANIIANEMDIPFFNVNATNLKDVKALSLYFSKIEQSCIVFIDEIHTLKKDVQTVLLSIMTDFAVSFINDAGEEERYELPQFTLIGATTQAGELLKPFLNRFAVIELEDYTKEEKLVLVKSKIEKMGYTAEEDAVFEIARRCRGIPRTIETYVKGIIDVMLMREETIVTKETACLYFEIHEIDGLGLTKNDIKILQILDEAEKPLALITLESKSGIQREDVEFRYEPYLLKLGLIDKMERGRVITKKGRKYLHPDEPDEGGDGGAQPAPAPDEPEAPDAPDVGAEEPVSDGGDDTSAPQPTEPDIPLQDDGAEDGERRQDPPEEADSDGQTDVGEDASEQN